MNTDYSRITPLLCLFFLVAVLTTSTARNDVKLYDMQLGKGAVGIFVENKSHSPYTVILNIKMRDMQADLKLPATLVIPPQTSKEMIAILIPNGRSAYYNYQYETHMGDVNAKHDDSQVYYLPFEKGASYKLIQGYDGRFSHKGFKSLDFQMNIGTKICAARSGTVIEMKTNSNKGCRNPSCKALSNYIYILHEDGSIASYQHLKRHGSMVRPGQKVKRGEAIGLSGNTGWTTGPHLHFEVFLPGMKKRRTVATRFLVNKGKVASLKPGTTYTACSK